MHLSIIIPVFNECESLEELLEQIATALKPSGVDYEVLFVDDGSRDSSWVIIQEQSAKKNWVRGIRFRRNFGKAAAVMAGMRAARGEIICLMDADLQDDPAELPKLLEKLDNGWDLINGWKKERFDPWHKVYPSKVFNALVRGLTGLKLHDHNCGFKVMRREVAGELRLYGELHRFIPVLAHARGFRVTEVSVHHRRRAHGESKYGFRRFLRGFLDLLTVAFLIGYRQRPQHMLGAAGVILFSLGSLGLVYLAWAWTTMNVFGIFKPEPIGNRPLLAYSIAATLLGAQALTLGLLAELLVYYTSRESDAYSIRTTCNLDQEPIPTRDSP